MKAIFVGGPKHGELCEIQDTTYTILAHEWVRTGSLFPNHMEPVEHTYYRRAVSVAPGRGIYVLMHNVYALDFDSEQQALIADAMARALGLHILGGARK